MLFQRSRAVISENAAEILVLSAFKSCDQWERTLKDRRGVMFGNAYRKENFLFHQYVCRKTNRKKLATDEKKIAFRHALPNITPWRSFSVCSIVALEAESISASFSLIAALGRWNNKYLRPNFFCFVFRQTVMKNNIFLSIRISKYFLFQTTNDILGLDQNKILSPFAFLIGDENLHFVCQT